MMSSGMNIANVAVLKVNSNTLYGCTYGSSILSTTNNGTTWNSLHSGLPDANITGAAFIGTNIFVSTSSKGVYRSSDNGGSWGAVNNGISYMFINTIASFGTNLYAGTGIGAFFSSNSGANWVQSNPVPAAANVRAFTSIGSTVYAAVYGSGVFSTTNSGANWLAVNSGITDLNVQTISANGNKLFAGSANATFYSSNSGLNWIAVNNGLGSNSAFTFTFNGNTVYAGTTQNRIFLSTNDGSLWQEISTGLPAPSASANLVYSLAINNGILFAGVQGNSVWKRPLSEITAIEPVETNLPGEFELKQNYPNPFNPSTNIEFSIIKRGIVKLSVYNVTGRLVRQLVDVELNAGTYKVSFEAAGISSGAYFYELESSGSRITKKMLLLK